MSSPAEEDNNGIKSGIQPQPETPNGAQQETTPTPPEQPTQMNIKIVDTNYNEINFRLKPTTKLKKAMDAYAQRQQRERKTLRFLFEGTRVLDEHTPDSLEMTDGDQIDVHTEQLGGQGV